MATRPGTAAGGGGTFTDCLMHPLDCATGAYAEAQRTTQSVLESAGDTAAGARDRLTAGVTGANATFTGFLDRGAQIAQWVAIALIALAVIALVFAAIYFLGPLVQVARNLAA